jgi:peroxiredoxin
MWKLLAGAFAAWVLAVFVAVLARPLPGAPEVRFTTLAGERIATSDLRGRVAVVSFWSTSCAICLKEMPQLVERHRAFAAMGYETIAVAIHSDHPARVRELAERRRLPYPVAIDAQAEAAAAFGNVRLTPTTFILGRDGRVLKRYVGKVPWPEFDRLVGSALARQAASLPVGVVRRPDHRADRRVPEAELSRLVLE